MDPVNWTSSSVLRLGIGKEPTGIQQENIRASYSTAYSEGWATYRAVFTIRILVRPLRCTCLTSEWFFNFKARTRDRITPPITQQSELPTTICSLCCLLLHFHVLGLLVYYCTYRNIWVGSVVSQLNEFSPLPMPSFTCLSPLKRLRITRLLRTTERIILPPGWFPLYSDWPSKWAAF